MISVLLVSIYFAITICLLVSFRLGDGVTGVLYAGRFLSLFCCPFRVFFSSSGAFVALSRLIWGFACLVVFGFASLLFFCSDSVDGGWRVVGVCILITGSGYWVFHLVLLWLGL